MLKQSVQQSSKRCVPSLEPVLQQLISSVDLLALNDKSETESVKGLALTVNGAGSTVASTQQYRSAKFRKYSCSLRR